MNKSEMSKLSRPIHPMSDEVRGALNRRELRAAYDARPPYQRNDYIGWINGAKRKSTRAKRLDQMLDELEGGELYMKMRYRARL